MEASDVFYSPFMIPIVAIVGAFVYAIIQTLARSRVRERIAMIERGLVPPPEVDPRGFDRAMNLLERRGSGRHRRAGITLMGVGFGLMVMIGFAGGEPGAAIGVGGFLVIMGAAFLVNSLFENPVDRQMAAPGPFTTPTPAPPRPVDPVHHD
jgi:hypothetical protein